jgi:hypothetical protein
VQKTFTLHKAQSRKWRQPSSGMWHCEGWYKSTNIWRHSTIIRLKSQNLHHLPRTSFTPGVLYASSCCELGVVYNKRFLGMKNTIDYICYGDSIYMYIYMGLFMNTKGRRDVWKQIEGCHVTCHSCHSHFYGWFSLHEYPVCMFDITKGNCFLLCFSMFWPCSRQIHVHSQLKGMSLH